MARDYILEDSNGYPFNSEFAPDFVKFGDRYHGYKNNSQEALFYYFAVMGYDLQFDYNGQTYYFLSTENYVARCDKDFKDDLEVFENANVMFRTFCIDGKKLVDIVDELTNADIL